MCQCVSVCVCVCVCVRKRPFSTCCTCDISQFILICPVRQLRLCVCSIAVHVTVIKIGPVMSLQLLTLAECY